MTLILTTLFRCIVGALAAGMPLSPPLPHLRRGEGVQGAKETEAKPKLGA